MNKVNGLCLSDNEVSIIQALIGHLLNTNDANEVAKKVAEIAKDNQGLFSDTSTGVGLTLLELMRHKERA